MFAAGLGWRDGSPLAPSYDQGRRRRPSQAIALLLDLGLDINAANDNGDTALHARRHRPRRSRRSCAS